MGRQSSAYEPGAQDPRHRHRPLTGLLRHSCASPHHYIMLRIVPSPYLSAIVAPTPASALTIPPTALYSAISAVTASGQRTHDLTKRALCR